jgi:hypothetical protein
MGLPALQGFISGPQFATPSVVTNLGAWNSSSARLGCLVLVRRTGQGCSLLGVGGVSASFTSSSKALSDKRNVRSTPGKTLPSQSSVAFPFLTFSANLHGWRMEVL